MGVPQPTATVRWNHMAAQNVSKKRKFVADGVFYAELNELLVRELAEDGYSGVEVRQTPARHEIIIRATRTQNVLGEKGRRIRELTAVVQKRFNFPPGSVELYAEKVLNRALWLSASPSATSSSEASLSAVHAMASSASSWRTALSVARWSCLARSGVSALRQ